MSYRAETLRECPLGCVPPKVMQTGKTRGYFQRSGTENPLFRTSPIGSQVLFGCALISQTLTELHHGNCRFQAATEFGFLPLFVFLSVHALKRNVVVSNSLAEFFMRGRG